MQAFCGSTTLQNTFLKLINNSKAKDKGNHAPWCVWISDEKLLVFASLISPSKSVCLRSYIKHLSQCFITISKTSKIVKNTLLRVVFSTLFAVFDMWWNTVSRVWYITSKLALPMEAPVISAGRTISMYGNKNNHPTPWWTEMHDFKVWFCFNTTAGTNYCTRNSLILISVLLVIFAIKFTQPAIKHH